MALRIVTVGLVIYCAAPAMAQTAQTSVPPAAVTAPPTQTSAPAAAKPATNAPPAAAKPASVVAKEMRTPIRMMEGILAVGIESAVENLAEQFREIDPNLVIFAGKEKVRGTFFEDYGVVFYLEIPSLRQAIIDSYQSYFPPPGPNRPVNVEVTTPTSISAKIMNSPCFQDSQHTRACYRAATLNSLTDVLLDSMVVPLRPSDTLTLWATPDDNSASGSGPSAAMILSVKGSDLDAFRAKQISRDEMKKRISVREF